MSAVEGRTDIEVLHRLMSERVATPYRRRGGPELLILGQDVDVTKLLLDLLDTSDALGASRSVARGRHGGPAGLTRYDRDRDRWGAVIER
jgi:hypothetical protein